VCLLLGALCQYPEMLTVICHLHISADLSTWRVPVQWRDTSFCS